MATVIHPSEQATQKVILPNTSWETYERLLADHQESSGLHFTYDQGTLEIVVPSLRHERLKHTMAALVELLAGEFNIDIEGAAFAGGPVALAYSRFDDCTRAVAHADYLASLAPYRTGNDYAIPGEFVIVRGYKT